MARFFRQKRTAPSFMHSKDEQEKSTSNSYDLVAVFHDSEPENANEILFEVQFMEKIRRVLRPCTDETDVLLSESEFPVEEKEFSEWMHRFFSSELSKMAMHGMLSDICMGPASREYFACEISSFAQRVVEKVGGQGKGKLVISAEMEVVTTIYDDERTEEATPGLDQKEWCRESY